MKNKIQRMMIAIGTPIVRTWCAVRFWLCEKIIGHEYHEIGEDYVAPPHVVCKHCGKIWFKPNNQSTWEPFERYEK